MNIEITARHINISDDLRDYAEKKIKKLDTYFNQLIDARVILHLEKLDHASEVLVNGDGVQFHGREKAKDFFSSIDLLFEKMEKQIVRYKEKHSSHKAVNPGKMATIDITTNEGRDFVLNQVSNKPVDKIEAFLEMKADNMDFKLFKMGISSVESEIDYSNKNYALIYKDGNTVKMIEIPFKKLKTKKFEHDLFIEYELKIVRDSTTDPKIKFKKKNKSDICRCSLDDAFQKIEKSQKEFLPFLILIRNTSM